MPEIPELTAIVAVINRSIAGQKVTSAEVRIPMVVRRPPKEEFEGVLTGNTLARAERKGKFVLLHFTSGHLMAVHLMLTGRLQLTESGSVIPKRTGWRIAFANGRELRYLDEKLDGKTYLVPEAERKAVPRLEGTGIDALDPKLTREEFLKRIKRYPGQIKNTLTNDAFITGVGNAYVDEILFEARVYPFTRTRELRPEQLSALYDAIHTVYAWAIPIVAERMGETINEKVRDFLKVHRKGGQPCPRCGSTIAEIEPNGRITSYCRKCQPGGLFK
jgi:formamidopyrimidine-DNA glycosylase